MKKLFFLLAVVGMLATACDDNGFEEENDEIPFIPEITYSPKSLEIKSEGGNTEITITANFEYEISENANWLSIQKTTNGLIVTASANYEKVKRTADIVLSNDKYNLSKTIKVSQHAYTPSITITPESINFDADGGKQTVEILANFEYEVTTDAKWITITHTKGGCTISASSYYEKDSRTASIVVSNKKYNISKVIKVVQSAFAPKITIDPETVNISAEGGKQSIKVVADFEHKAITDAEWLTIAKTNDGYTVSAPAYYEVEPRVAEVTISNEKYDISKVIKVSQSAFTPKITINPETVNISAEGDEQSVKITANFEYEAITDAQWLTITKSNEGYTICASTNYETERRTANIVISSTKYGISKNIKVVQDKLNLKRCILYTTSNSSTIALDGAYFGAIIISNIYKNGKGVVLFDRDVTSIAWFAFSGCSSLTSITIPNSVTEIGTYAFKDCSSLTSITISDSVTSIGECAFSGCTGELIINSKIIETNYKYDNSPAYNSSGWLYGSKFTKLTIGNNITKIGNYVFADYSSLTSITIPKSVTEIGAGAFYNCRSLTSVTIPNSVILIGETAFGECSSLASVTIPNSITEIGNYVFVYCRSLTRVTIPSSVTSIGEYAFGECSSLTGMTIPNSVTSIGTYAFYNCRSLTSTTIPNNVIEIGSGAFYDCRSLTSVTIPDSVTSIGGHAFYNCCSLTSVTIGKGVTSFGEDIFEGCTGELIVNCNIPSRSDYYVGVFYRSMFTKVTIGSSVTSIGDYAFYDCNSITSVTIGNNVTSIGADVFAGCSDLASITIGNTVTSIGENAFEGCSSLTRITIPNSVTSIGSLAFSDCSSLASITIGNGVTSIEEAVFWECSSLTKVTIPNSVTSIGEDAFFGCSSLTSVTIPNGVTSIGNDAFYNCNNLKSVYCKATTPPIGGTDMYSYYYSFISSKPIGCKIYVPKASVTAYKSAQYWSDYADYIVGYDF